MADNSARTPGAGESIRTVDKGGNKATVVIVDSGGSGAEDIGAGVIIRDGGNSITVDNGGTFAVQADTELPAASALNADNVAAPTAPAVGAFAHVYDGANWDRQRGDSTDGTLVNLGANNDVTVTSGNITADTELPAAAAMSDTISRTLSTPQVGSLLMVDNGANYVRAPGDLTNGLDVDITRLPASTNTLEVVGDVAQDVGVAGNPLLMGGRASTAAPTDMSTDGDSVYVWLDRKGAVVNTGYAAEDAPLAGNPVRVGWRASNAVPSAMSGDGDIVTPWADRSGSPIVQGGTRWGSTTAITFNASLQSLANSTTVGQVSTEVDLTATYYSDVLVFPYVTMTTAGSPTGVVTIYILASLDGTNYSGDTNYSGTNGGYTLGAAGSMNLPFGTSIKPHANTNRYNGKPISLRALFGVIPPFFAVVVLNSSGIALHSSGNGADYRGVNSI